MPGREIQGNAAEIRDRLYAATEELTALYRELYWVTFQGDHHLTQHHVLGELPLKEVMRFKQSVDSIREFLWKFLDAASQAEPLLAREAMQDQGVLRMTRLLQLLREGLVQPAREQPLSFIERMNECVGERLSSDGKAA